MKARTHSRPARGHRRLLALAAALPLLAGCFPVAAAAPVTDPVQAAYGTRSARRVGWTVLTVTGEELRSRPAARVEELLRGRFPGLEVASLPDGGYALRIRGQRSLRGSNEPLVLLDGLPLASGPNALATVDPRDVRRIDVLRGAAATAMYGGRGANGAILVFTRYGR